MARPCLMVCVCVVEECEHAVVRWIRSLIKSAGAGPDGPNPKRS